jgi:site-specific DNA recombinase
VSRSLIVGTAKESTTGRRIPAANLEALVITKLRSFLADAGAVLNVIREEHVDGAAQSRLIGRGVKIAKEIESLTPDRIRVILMTLISRVDIRPDYVEISVRRSHLVELLVSGSIGLVTQRGTPDNEDMAVLTLTVRARLQRVGREMKMLVENTDDQTKADPALLRIVARARDIQERLMQNSGLTLRAIAGQEHVTPGYVSRLLRLTWLAPDIITAIVNGKNPPQLTAKQLMRLALEISVDRSAQRKLLGFHAR